MTRRAVTFAAAAAVALAIACGDVPTLDSGIAYITTVVLPSPAVAAGDVLRDSTGAVAPLSVKAYDKDNHLVPGVTATYVVSTLPAGITIDANGRVTALDTIGTVQIVGRVGDRLQTPSVVLAVVPQPDSIAASGLLDSLTVGTASSALMATVTGVRGPARVNVAGIIVRYRIAAFYPAATVDPVKVFFTDGLTGDLTRSVDTTDASGTASKIVTLSTRTGIDSVRVEASATNLRGVPLKGSPVRFILHVKKG